MHQNPFPVPTQDIFWGIAFIPFKEALTMKRDSERMNQPMSEWIETGKNAWQESPNLWEQWPTNRGERREQTRYVFDAALPRQELTQQSQSLIQEAMALLDQIKANLRD
jgi:hypothetical protein